MTDQTRSNSSDNDGIEWVKDDLIKFRRILFRVYEQYGLMNELIRDLFIGKKLASNVLTSFCEKFKKKIVFNQTTSNYNYANYVTSKENWNKKRFLFEFYSSW